MSQFKKGVKQIKKQLEGMNPFQAYLIKGFFILWLTIWLIGLDLMMIILIRFILTVFIASGSLLLAIGFAVLTSLFWIIILPFIISSVIFTELPWKITFGGEVFFTSPQLCWQEPHYPETLAQCLL